MIIFYNKTTGKIVGAFEGRIHDPKNNMWIGSPEVNDRIVVNWKKEDGVYVPDVQDSQQKALFIAIDKKPSIVYDLMVEVKSKRLVHNKKKA